MQNEPISYPLPIETIPSLELSRHVDDLIEVRDFLEGRDIRTANTRIERYTNYLRQAATGGYGSVDAAKIFKGAAEGPFEQTTDWLLYVLREAHELMWILKGLRVHIPRGIDAKLKIIVGGRDFAALDKDSTSRDAQFELRIASYFCQSNCEVDLSTETDIVAVSDDQAFYLECKRVGSKNKLSKRLSEAKAQLRGRMPKKSGARTIYGCIAVDVTKLAFSHNGLTFAMTNEHSRDVVQKKLIGIAVDSQKLPLFRDCSNLFGYWFQIHIPSLILQPPTTATRFSSFHIFRDSMSRKESKSAKAFRHIFESSSQDDRRTIPAKPLTPRLNFTFPSGTEFSVDESVFKEFWEHGEVVARGINDEVATLKLNNREHAFSFLDFTMVLPSLTDQWRMAMAGEADRARLELVVRMYAQRFPYEESEELSELPYSMFGEQ